MDKKIVYFMNIFNFVLFTIVIISCLAMAQFFVQLEDYTNMFLSLILLMLFYKELDLTKLNKQEVKTNGNN